MSTSPVTPFTEADRLLLKDIRTLALAISSRLAAVEIRLGSFEESPPEPAAPVEAKKPGVLDWIKVGLGAASVAAPIFVKNPSSINKANAITKIGTDIVGKLDGKENP